MTSKKILETEENKDKLYAVVTLLEVGEAETRRKEKE